MDRDDDGNPKYEKLNLDGRGFRLLTEAEWEVVCRGGIATAYSFGSDVSLLANYGWYQENSEQWSHPVGSLRPNVRGLFDIHGNLFEWCHNKYGQYVEESLVVDPHGSDGGSLRVNRGGSWFGGAALCRSAIRYTGSPADRSTFYGLRLALSPSIQLLEAKRLTIEHGVQGAFPNSHRSSAQSVP